MVLGQEKLRIRKWREVFRRLVANARTQENADWRIVPTRHLVLAIIGHVEAQLRNILVVQFLRLKLNQDMAFEDAVIENEVDSFVDIINQDVLLLILETKASPKFSDEGLEIVEDSSGRAFVVIPVNWLDTVDPFPKRLSR